MSFQEPQEGKFKLGHKTAIFRFGVGAISGYRRSCDIRETETIMMTLEETLDALYRDMEEHGNRVQYFSPYIPLVITGTGTNLAPPGMVAYAGGWADAESVAYAEKVNASGERNVWTSDLIRSLGGLVEILDDIKDVGVRQR